jgi:Flp pilus assembly protein TadD
MMLRIVAAFVLACAATGATAQACGSLINPYGPFDYRTQKAQLAIVEKYHFTPDVEGLRHGSTAALGGDIDYTLRASPNHHRALNSMVQLALRLKTDKPHGAEYTVDCYFNRAMRFAPDDGLVLVIYGVYLSRTNRKAEAVRFLEQAKKHEGNNPNLYYDLGLIYFDLKDYPTALTNAQRAYELGAALPGLRNKLEAAGKWHDAQARKGGAAGAAPGH